MNLFTTIEHAAPGPAKVLIAAPDESVTYGQAFALAARFANLLERRGVAPGDRVAVQTEKSWPALVLYLGCLRAGAVYLPLNPAYTPVEVEHFLRDAEPHVLVCDQSRAERPGASRRRGRRGPRRDDGTRRRGQPPRRRRVRSRASTSMWSGPTTTSPPSSTPPGRPAGPRARCSPTRTSGRTPRRWWHCWRFTAADVLIHALPIFHTHGLFVATNVVLLAGASMIFLPGFDADAILRAMPRATTMMGVPTFYTRLLHHPDLDRDATAGMRLFVSGSAPLLAETHEAWRERTGHAILERYGMTETGMSTSNPYDGERRAGTVGFPLPGVSVRVADAETGSVLGADEIGVLEVTGPNVFSGYWRLPDKTAEELRPDGWFITGDLARIDADGYVHIVGRSKDLIITGGLNVYPKEVEEVIDALPGVVESAVFGIPHDDFGEAVVAAVVAGPDADLSEATILSGLGTRLARFKQPKRVFVVPELPRNSMAKVQKNVLRDDYRRAFEPD